MIKRSARLANNYSVVDNRIIEDKRLSLDSRLILIYLLSKPDYWVVSTQDLINQTLESPIKTGKKAIYRILNEIISSGYAERTPVKNLSGRIEKWDYLIFDSPQSPEGKVGKPQSPEGKVGKPQSPEGKVANNMSLHKHLEKQLPQSPQPQVADAPLVSTECKQVLSSFKFKTTSTESVSYETLVELPRPAAKSKKFNGEDTVDIFEYWKSMMNHQSARLDEKRKSLITKAMKVGYAPDEIKKAIEGCKYSPWFMGENDRGQVYDGLHTILSEKNIDKFIEASDKKPKEIVYL
ncbi:MAG: hypothetical protein ABL933_15705 [Methyloglobulus sp.]